MTRGVRNGSDLDSTIAELYGAIKQQIIFFAAETGLGAHWVAERLSALLSPERERVLHHLPAMHRETAGHSGRLEPLALAQHAYSGETPITVDASPAGGNAKTHRPSRLTREARAAISKAQKERWKKKREQKKPEPEPKPVKGQKQAEYWARMTPEERSKESARRRKKWSPESRAKWAGTKPAKVGRPALRELEERKRKERDSRRKRESRARMKVKAKSGKNTAANGRQINSRGHALLTTPERDRKQKVYAARNRAKATGKPLPPLPARIEQPVAEAAVQ